MSISISESSCDSGTSFFIESCSSCDNLDSPAVASSSSECVEDLAAPDEVGTSCRVWPSNSGTPCIVHQICVTDEKVMKADKKKLANRPWNCLIKNPNSSEYAHKSPEDIKDRYLSDHDAKERNGHFSEHDDTEKNTHFSDHNVTEKNRHLSISDVIEKNMDSFNHSVDTMTEHDVTTVIVSDYDSVRDDESIHSEGFSTFSCGDQDELLSHEVACSVEPTSCTQMSCIGQGNLSKTDLAIFSNKANSFFEQIDKTLEGAQSVTTGEATSKVTHIVLVTNSQLPPMSEPKLDGYFCLYPRARDSPAGCPQPLPTTFILPAQFANLPQLIPPELPFMPLPPIIYITTDEKPHLKLQESCTVEMNILQKTELANVTPHYAERCDSQLSTLSEKQDICRICHCEGDTSNKLISPCLCSGSLKYIHLSCLQKWIKSSDKKSCELCNFDYIMTMKTRPFKQWEKLDMTIAERRKIVCSVTFHVIAVTCVIWSLYVLIDRTTEEVSSGTLDWPFWTKLIVVAIGFTGGLVFMYVQCKMYMQLCLRWRQFNKLINIENASEDAQVRADAAARIKARSTESGGVVNTVALQEVDSF